MRTRDGLSTIYLLPRITRSGGGSLGYDTMIMPPLAARSPPLHLLEHTEFPPALITRHIRSVGIGTAPSGPASASARSAPPAAAAGRPARSDRDRVRTHPQPVRVENRPAVGDVELPSVPRATHDLALTGELQALLVGGGEQSSELSPAERPRPRWQGDSAKAPTTPTSRRVASSMTCRANQSHRFTRRGERPPRCRHPRGSSARA